MPGGSGWRVASAPLQYVEFGLAHPGVFAVMAADPRPGPLTPVVAAGLDGRLRMSEARVVALIQSVGAGTVLTLLRQPEERRDLVPLETAHDAVVAAVTGEPAGTVDPGPSGAATSLRASLDRTAVLTAAERSLLREPLERIADGD